MNPWFLSIRDAFSFLTILPLPCPIRSDRPAERMSKALAWFPLVGAVVGVLAAGAAWLVWREWSQAMGAWAGLTALAVLTGGLHLDGFADTADGFGSWKGKDETLEIMRDSRIGTMGAVGLILLLGLKWSLLREIGPEFWVRSLVTVCALSRLAMVLSAQLFPYAPGKSGLGRWVTDRREPAAAVIALATAFAVAAFAFGPKRALVLTAATLAIAWLANLCICRKLGGITGDTLGAVNEITELAILLVLGMSG